MAYRICKSFEIESGHMLSKHPDKCRFPHGHSRTIEFVLEADELDANGMVCDFKVLSAIMGDFMEGWDHSLAMNTDDPQFEMMRRSYGDRIIAFECTDPTTEVMAKTLFDVCLKGLDTYLKQSKAPYPLRRTVRLVSVRVWETSSSWAEYRG